MSDATQTVIVSAGKNVGETYGGQNGAEITAQEWFALIDRLRDAITHELGAEIVFTGIGIGSSDQWGDETAVTIIGAGASTDPSDVVRFGIAVEAARTLARQDAIAVTLGQTVFVSADSFATDLVDPF